MFFINYINVLLYLCIKHKTHRFYLIVTTWYIDLRMCPFNKNTVDSAIKAPSLSMETLYTDFSDQGSQMEATGTTL